jgi:glycopeptide antibiotics resistance protein
MRNVMGMCIVALMIPVFIEGTQYFIGRSVDIDDVILNAWAIIFGYWIWKICVTIMILLKK